MQETNVLLPVTQHWILHTSEPREGLEDSVLLLRAALQHTGSAGVGSTL